MSGLEIVEPSHSVGWLGMKLEWLDGSNLVEVDHDRVTRVELPQPVRFTGRVGTAVFHPKLGYLVRGQVLESGDGNHGGSGND